MPPIFNLHGHESDVRLRHRLADQRCVPVNTHTHTHTNLLNKNQPTFNETSF